MDNGKELLLPEVRIQAAKQSILTIIPQLDHNNLMGLGIFGSFWDSFRRNPHDIDIACFVVNDAIFLDDDSPVITASLQQFQLPVEYHFITPYSVSVRRELENLQVRLAEMHILWGKMPDWLLKS